MGFGRKWPGGGEGRAEQVQPLSWESVGTSEVSKRNNKKTIPGRRIKLWAAKCYREAKKQKGTDNLLPVEDLETLFS